MSPFGEIPVGLRAHIESLSTLLSRPVIMRVPSFQRPYTWEEGEIAQLFDDLRGAYERRSLFYYVGQMVFVSRGLAEVEIADGQQRLATLTMFLAYVRDRVSHRGPLYQSLIALENGEPRLRLRRADENFYHEHVQKPGNLQRLALSEDATTDSQGLLCAAAEVISRLLNTMSTTQLDALASFVCRNSLFTAMVADERGGALTVFNSMNRAGRLISGPDILKSELLERSNLRDEELEAAAHDWENLEDRLGRRPFADLIEMTPQLLLGEPIRSPGDLGAFRRALDERTTPQKFLSVQLPIYGKALSDVRKATVAAGPHAQDVNRRILCMQNTQSDTWTALLVRFISEFGDDHETLAAFVRALELLTFAKSLNRVEDREARIAQIWEAGGDARKLDSPEFGLALTTAEKRSVLERIRAPFKRDTRADASLRRLMCARTNAALPGGRVVRVRGEDVEDVSVEHVLPARGGRTWEANFPTPELRERYAQVLGNWTLVTHAQNREAGSKSYEIKRKIYFNTPDVPVHALTRLIEDVADWNQEAIDRRHSMLVALLARDLRLVD